LLVALPVALVLLLISFIFRTEVLRIAREQTTEAVVRTAQSLDAEAMNFALFTSALMNDEVLLEQARYFIQPKDPEQKYLAARGMEKSISWFFRITSRIGSVFLFFRMEDTFSTAIIPAMLLIMTGFAQYVWPLTGPTAKSGVWIRFPPCRGQWKTACYFHGGPAENI